MKKYILFDLDGTLTDSAPGIINSFRYALKHYNLPDMTDNELKQFVGPPLMVSFSQILGFGEEKGLEAVGVYRRYFSTKGLFENEVYEGIPIVLEKLKSKGFTLAVSTSKPEVYAKRILEHFDLVKYFAEVCGIPLVDEGMTKAQVIAVTLKKLGVSDKAQVLMVGDRDYDVKGAHDNGIDCIGVLYGYGSRDELESAGAEHIAETAEDMADLICSLG
ncbi:MAG: HAD hydrolase-like protein [Oscillospiraceae bacterium]|nr:HAD hydrolase-like protein [Oscillospiraceae bacterium]